MQVTVLKALRSTEGYVLPKPAVGVKLQDHCIGMISSYACLISLSYASDLQLPPITIVQMANRPTGVYEAIEFVWNQPDTVLQSSEKQSLSAILAKETDVVARRYFLAPLPE